MPEVQTPGSLSDAPKWKRLLQSLKQEGWRPAVERVVRWVYWTSHLDLIDLHSLPVLRDILYFDGLEQTVEGRQTIAEVLVASGEPYRVIPLHHLQLKVDLQDLVIGRKIFMYREWEPFETRLFVESVQPGMTVLDLGAHIGYYALHAAHALENTGRVFAFEPVRSNFALLQDNVHLNHFENVLTPVNVALSDHSHILDMYLSDENAGDHRVYPTTAEDDALFHSNHPRRTERVEAVTVDSFLQERFVQHVDLIKMDVQGAELQVLSGMGQTLCANPQILLFFEYWYFGLVQGGTPPHQPLELLEQWGFHFWQIDPQAERLLPISARQAVSFCAQSDPTHQVDMIAARTLDAAPRLARHVV